MNSKPSVFERDKLRVESLTEAAEHISRMVAYVRLLLEERDRFAREVSRLRVVDVLARDVVAENFIAGRARLAAALGVVWVPNRRRPRCRIGRSFQRRRKLQLGVSEHQARKGSAMTLKTLTIHTWTCDKCGKNAKYEDGGQPNAWISIQSASVDFSQAYLGFGALYHFCQDCRSNALAVLRNWCAKDRRP
jgi:hypothetical protein